MKNQKILMALLGAAIIASVVALPKLGHADGLSIHADGVNVNIHDGDGDHHHEHHWIRHEEMDAALGASACPTAGRAGRTRSVPTRRRSLIAVSARTQSPFAILTKSP